MNSSSWRVSSIVLLVVCLLWMDTCLYFQIQFFDDDGNTTAKSAAAKEAPIDQIWNASSAARDRGIYNGTTGNGKFIPPIELIDKFSFAFRGMSVKLMMTNPVDNYIFAPLSAALVDLINLKDNLLFITPNMISYAGVASALIAAKLVTYESPTMHKLSFVMFQLRTWLDDLDGDVARSRMGLYKHSSLQKTSGYVVDGVCDTIGFIAYVIGCYIYMKKSVRRMRKSRTSNLYNLQSITEVKSRPSDQSAYIPLQQERQPDDCSDNDSQESYSDGHELRLNFDGQIEERRDSHDVGRSSLRRNLLRTSGLSKTRIYLKKIGNGRRSTVVFYRFIKEKIKRNLSSRKIFLLVLCFLLQLAMCSTFWNRYILVYTDLLESPSSDFTQATNKRKILKSNIMYVVIWFWRLTNGHSFMQMLVASILLGKIWQFLEFIKYLGFLEIILLVTITELHVIDVRNYLSVSQAGVSLAPYASELS